MKNLTPIIGLEVHVELNTKSKMFCSCSTKYFGQKPNTHTCPVCLGLPGALPVPNSVAITSVINIAQALNCEINKFSKFDRKNYFYPDLSKGYQISQYDLPFGEKGFLELESGKKVRITRVHMEEDTGKLTHKTVNGEKVSLVDFNRSGVPLVEIVTEPDFNDAIEVKEYLQKLQQIVRYLNVSNADMDKGEMRLEPNISLSEDKNILPNYKVEVKNINSFRFVEKAINFEIKRQAEILNTNKTPIQETRGWDDTNNLTFSQRIKEEANDYRYFPEPDIPPIRHTTKQISTMLSNLPELPSEKLKRFIDEYSLSSYDAEILTRDSLYAAFYESLAMQTKNKGVNAKMVANYLINKKIKLTSDTAQIVEEMIKTNSKDEIPEQISLFIIEVINENEKAVQDFKSGKESVIMFLLGQTMRKIGKRVDTDQVKKLLIEKLNS